jgi:serpin B
MLRTADRRRGLVAIAVIVLSSCGSPPSTSPPATPSSVAERPSPTLAEPTSPPFASPSPSSYVPALRSVVVTVSDRLRVRSQPRVSDDSVKYDPVLPLGTELFVLDGPVSGSGYTWYKVAPVSFAELGGPGSGWVAMAATDGQPWIGPASGPAAGLSLAMAEVPRAAADPADARRAAASINAFGLDLQRRLVADPALELRTRNVVFSPTSIALALAMARAGAAGDTATQMDKVLHAKGWDSLAAGLNSLDQALASRNATWNDGEGPKELTLRLANAPFGQSGWTIKPDYLDALGSAFGAGLRSVDYAADPEAARQTINAWVSQRTAGKIPTLLSKDDITSDTRLTLVNAIYLKAQWATWFPEDGTKPAPFTRLDGSRVDVPTMQRWGGQELPYARGDGWQATELTYLGPAQSHRLAMLLVLPKDLPTFEAGLTAARLEGIAAAVSSGPKPLRCPGVPADQQDAGCYAYALTLSMPRFGIDTRADLNQILKSLGMPLAFDPGTADFSGIHAPDPLYISAVIHQATIDVDEKGTEAAAATAVGMDTGGGPSPAKEITLRLDHPFLFFVRDLDTGAVLFMGRVTDPSQVKGG